MAKNSIRDFSATAASNTDIQSVDIDENCAASGINNAIRELMADLADVNAGTVAMTNPSADSLSTDTISEKTSGSGVTIDSVLLKDGALGSIASAVAAHLTSINGGQIGGNRNLIINGAMTINQRGTQTGVYTNTYGLDRFGLGGSGSQRLTYSQSTTVPSGQGFSNSLKLDVTTADTSVAASDYEILSHRFEGQDLQHLKYGTSGAKSLTLQFWVRSPKTGIHIVEIQHADAGYINPQPYTIASANTWQKVEVTFDGYQTTAITDDNTLGFLINWWLMAGSNYSSGTLTANNWHNTTVNRAAGQVNVMDSTSNEFYLTGVQLEVGGTATEFEHRSIGDELARCKRYFQILSDEAYSGTGNTNYLQWWFSPEMRATPTISGDVTGTADGTNKQFAQRYNSGNSHAIFYGGSNPTKADAEL